ncbi:hypothetical protein P4S72_19815 [Vibrio sp. PP-XX7]
MNRWICLMLVVLGGAGCAAHQERLGHHVNVVRAAQIYNPDATAENLQVIPAGGGERMEKTYDAYIGADKAKNKSKPTTLVISEL